MCLHSLCGHGKKKYLLFFNVCVGGEGGRGRGDAIYSSPESKAQDELL